VAEDNALALRDENEIVLKSMDRGTLRADLDVDGQIIAQTGGTHAASGTVSWLWRPDRASVRHVLGLRIEGDGEYRFEVSDKKGMDDELAEMADEIRAFSLGLVYSRYGDEIKRRQHAWFDHISAHWKALSPIVELIARAPHHTLSRRRVKKPIQEVDRIDPEVVRSIFTDLEAVDTVSGGAPALKTLLGGVPVRVTVEEDVPDYDVDENRLLKHHLKTLATQIGGLLDTSMQRDGILRSALKHSDGEETVEAAKEFLSNHKMMKRIELMRRRIEAWPQDPLLSFLGQVSSLKPPQGATPVLMTNPHYSRFFQKYKAYNESAPPPLLRPRFTLLERDRDPRDLYSRWCAVKVLEEVIRRGYHLEKERLIHQTDEEIAVDMPEGLVSTLTKGETRLDLFHGRRYLKEPPYGSYSAPKAVSIALEAFRGDEVPRIAVFEPVYDHGYTEEKFESRDVDRLHVLRDALVDLRTDSHERLVVGGCILHPSNMKAVRYDGLSAVSLRPGTDGGGLDETLEALLG